MTKEPVWYERQIETCSFIRKWVLRTFLCKEVSPKIICFLHKRKNSSFICTLFVLFFFFSCTTPEEKGVKAIKIESAKKYVETLAHDSLEGRRAYTEGSLKAADYIAGCLRDMGITPYKDSYFQDFKTKDSKVYENGMEYHLIPPGEMVRNVIGIIEGKDTSNYVIVGAHYDHLGKSGNQLEDSIYNGADDNASGVSAVLQIANAFIASGEKPLNTVIFAFWDAEEMGLIGSKCFVKSFEDIKRVQFYLNLDMIGRDNKDSSSQVAVVYSYTIMDQEQFFNDKIEKYRLNLEIVRDKDSINQNFTYNFFSRYENVSKDFSMFNQNSDHAPFDKKNVSFLLFTSGLHRDYHELTDHAEMINWEKLTDITKLSFITLYKFANIEM